MTAQSMKMIDLKRWNLVQVTILHRFGINAEPDTVLAFGEWFANEVDYLHRLPRSSEFHSVKRRFLSVFNQRRGDDDKSEC